MKKKKRPQAKTKVTLKNFIYRLARLSVRPGDTIVLQTDMLLDVDQVTAIRDRANEQFRHLKAPVVILTAGMKLGVLRRERKP